MEGLVTVVTQYLAAGLVLPSTHTACTEPALATRVVFTVAAVRLLLACFSLVFCVRNRYDCMTVWRYGFESVKEVV